MMSLSSAHTRSYAKKITLSVCAGVAIAMNAATSSSLGGPHTSEYTESVTGWSGLSTGFSSSTVGAVSLGGRFKGPKKEDRQMPSKKIQKENKSVKSSRGCTGKATTKKPADDSERLFKEKQERKQVKHLFNELLKHLTREKRKRRQLKKADRKSKIRQIPKLKRDRKVEMELADRMKLEQRRLHHSGELEAADRPDSTGSNPSGTDSSSTGSNPSGTKEIPLDELVGAERPPIPTNLEEEIIPNEGSPGRVLI
jgi:hypothetical protein